MDPRHFESGASGTPPSAPLVPSVGYPTDGVPGVTPPTVPGAHWFWQIAEELRYMLTSAGITPNAAVTTQLREAIDKVVGTSVAVTPELRFGGASTGITYSTRYGRAVRQNDLVHVFGHMVLSSVGSAVGNASIFCDAPISAYGDAIAQVHVAGGVGLPGMPSGLVSSGTDSVVLRYFDGSTGSGNALTNAHFAAGSIIIYHACYPRV